MGKMLDMPECAIYPSSPAAAKRAAVVRDKSTNACSKAFYDDLHPPSEEKYPSAATSLQVYDDPPPGMDNRRNDPLYSQPRLSRHQLVSAMQRISAAHHNSRVRLARAYRSAGLSWEVRGIKIRIACCWLKPRLTVQGTEHSAFGCGLYCRPPAAFPGLVCGNARSGRSTKRAQWIL
jgi:hypothetical protein